NPNLPDFIEFIFVFPEENAILAAYITGENRKRAVCFMKSVASGTPLISGMMQHASAVAKHASKVVLDLNAPNSKDFLANHSRPPWKTFILRIPPKTDS